MRALAALLAAVALLASAARAQSFAGAGAADAAPVVWLVPAEGVQAPSGGRSLVLRPEAAVLLPRGLTVSADAPPTTGALVTGGVVGGLVGTLVGGGLGALAGAAQGCVDCYFAPGLVLGVLGGAAGLTVGVPVGVWSANGSRGRLGAALLGSLVTAAAGLSGVAGIAGDVSGVSGTFLLLAIPAAQVAVSVAAIR